MNRQREQARLLYAALAPRYDAETRFIRGIRQEAIATLELRPGETVLDSGCGTGWCLPALSSLVGQSGSVIGFEPSPEMLAQAQARAESLGNTHLHLASGEDVQLPLIPDAILFSYTHDLLRSRAALANIFRQARRGTRIVATSTQLFPRWFFLGNWYLRRTHRATITNFEGFDRPWSLLPEFCETWAVRTTVPGSRYIFRGILRQPNH
ncbi:MAG TPA: methyltransferase domain-containing protein [Usitatibacteraceae bacterium]|nr:methyltransferase domain-containing protein [Usitatibacteraceae bacterium]